MDKNIIKEIIYYDDDNFKKNMSNILFAKMFIIFNGKIVRKGFKNIIIMTIK